MEIDEKAVAALGDRVLGPEHKSVPAAAWGRTAREFLDTEPHLDDFQTPVFTLDRSALTHNLAVMGELAEAAGVRLAPHGKTTMAPQLWAEQLAAGCWGITLATPWQVQVARSFGVRRIVLANTLVDPHGLRWVAEELARDPAFEFVCWADSVATVALMDQQLRAAPGTGRIRVLVELGGAQARTGARTIEEGHAIAAAIERADRLILAGVGGYEGALARDRTPESIATLRHYLDDVARLHREFAAAGRYRDDAIVTAGGSSYQDLVLEHLAGLADEQGAQGVPTTVVLRSGAYLIHDDGLYAEVSPLIPQRSARPLRAAMHAWARVLSRPEPGLALLDAGRRDVPFDSGLPVPQHVVTQDLSGVDGMLDSMAIGKLADQHAFLRMPNATADDLPVGTVLRLGLSHPCTAFDKWRLIPVIDDADARRPRVVDLVHTFF
ncbi:amino acid deaminase [Nocardia sp. XZ_19_385]|uniref:amino acid deaminase n=1 Tax=Nocardia sp. XZ_19_385 TaxID=2769488 RepID=UPI00188E14CC|nr:amino acid deaminase [Nocardia sp. XZ_19_385]